jgi:hypothetical protein
MPIIDSIQDKAVCRSTFRCRYWLALVPALALLSCFGGVQHTGKVVGYKNGRVLTKEGFYQVGSLPAEWQRVNLDKAMVAFYSPQLNSTISTDSFCEQAYNDSSLDSLTRHLFPGLQDTKVIQQQSMMLSERGGLQTIMSASLDGVPVMLNLVVVKKDWCLFDFFLVSEKNYFEKATEDFEKFFRGFSFEKGS